jgi:hypothetical protein
MDSLDVYGCLDRLNAIEDKIKFDRQASIIIANKDLFAGLNERIKDNENHIDEIIKYLRDKEQSKLIEEA